jgi:hypothetical protein
MNSDCQLIYGAALWFINKCKKLRRVLLLVNQHLIHLFANTLNNIRNIPPIQTRAPQVQIPHKHNPINHCFQVSRRENRLSELH